MSDIVDRLGEVKFAMKFDGWTSNTLCVEASNEIIRLRTALAAAEKERDEWRTRAHNTHELWLDTEDRATAAEAALEGARKVIEAARMALRVAVEKYDEMHIELADIDQWLSANPEVKE